jgi:GDPmannose 4,6-dehydratase
MHFDVRRRAIIVGSNGQDGQLLTALLRSKNYEVVGVSRMTHDISNPMLVEELVQGVKPDELYYLAAHHQSSEAVPESGKILLEQSIAVNFLSFGYFLQTLVQNRYQCAVFYASTSHVFPSNEWGTLSEESEKKPGSIYAITKFAGMQLCNLYRLQYGLKVSAGILFNHESSLRNLTFLSKRIARAAVSISREGRGKLSVGKLDSIVDWGAAEDFVDAMHRMLQLDASDDFIVATGVPHSVADFAEIAFKHVGLNYRNHIEINPMRMTRAPETRIGNPSKLMQATGWKINIPFEDMVVRLVEDELNKP